MVCPKCQSPNVISVWPKAPERFTKIYFVIQWILIIVSLGTFFTLLKMLNFKGSGHIQCLDCGYESDDWKHINC